MPFGLNRTLFRNRIDGCRQDLCGSVTKSGARDRVGHAGRARDAACASGMTAVGSMPELARRQRSGTPQERSGASRGSVVTLHHDLRALHCRDADEPVTASATFEATTLKKNQRCQVIRIVNMRGCLPLRGA